MAFITWIGKIQASFSSSFPFFCHHLFSLFSLSSSTFLFFSRRAEAYFNSKLSLIALGTMTFFGYHQDSTRLQFDSRDFDFLAEQRGINELTQIVSQRSTTLSVDFYFWQFLIEYAQQKNL